MESKIKKNVEVISDDPVINAFLAGSKHRAAWLGLIYKEGMKDGQEELIRRYLWDATYSYGQMAGKLLKSRLPMDPVDCEKFVDVFGVNTFRGEALQAKVTAIVPERVDLEYHGCTLLSTWKGLGLDDVTCRSLCEITMNQDTAIADALGLHFDLKETLADGGECCKCSYYR